MRYMLSFAHALTIAVLIPVATGETEESITRRVLSHSLSEQRPPLVAEAFELSGRASRFLSGSVDRYISPDLPVPGDIVRDRKKTLVLGEQTTVVSVGETSAFHGENYECLLWYDLNLKPIGAAVYSDIESPGKLIALIPGHGISDIANVTLALEESYIASKGEIRIEDTPELEGVVVLPQASLKPGVYSAFNGPNSAIILDGNGGLIVILVGEGDSCDMYVVEDGEIVVAGVEETDKAGVPSAFSLSQNHPNPFNPATTIAYDLPQASDVTLTIYNLLGQEIVKLVDTQQPSGYYTVKWDASQMSGGIYLYRLEVAGQFEETKRMVFLK